MGTAGCHPRERVARDCFRTDCWSAMGPNAWIAKLDAVVRVLPLNAMERLLAIA